MPASAPLHAELSPHRLVATRFEALDGFGDDDHLAAFDVFKVTARAILDDMVPLRPALSPDDGLRALCRRLLTQAAPRSRREAREMFEAHFVPHRVETGTSGFLTGYYEPLIDGSLDRSEEFSAPILCRPERLGRFGPGVAEHPYLTRAEIEARLHSGDFTPLVWLRDWVEVFFVHVQGSARVRLPDGRMIKLIYDGRNGQPYTSIGRILVERGDIPASAMSLDRLKGWIRAEGQEIGQAGRALMQRNRSYIFFRADSDRPGEGPVGGAGVPLAPLRSIAVDRTIWPYGLPFFVETAIPWRSGAAEPFGRLMVAQDTGSAILGAARADLYFGTGDEAGRRAGDIRHPATFTVLLPRSFAGGA